MNFWILLVLSICLSNHLISASNVPESDDTESQGLYSKSDKVIILTNKNFEQKIYGQKHAFLIQFYNSYCGHCRAFAPKFKSLAKEIESWKPIIKLAVLDCSDEENIEICRQFEVMAYPSLRYLHENYIKGNANVGDKFQATDSVEKLKSQIVIKMQKEQSMGHLSFAPSLSIGAYTNLKSALGSLSKDNIYTFLVFETENSTVGSELALDINDYEHIKLKRINENSELAGIIGIKKVPGLVAVEKSLATTLLTPNNPVKQNLLLEINTFLKSKNYIFPKHDIKHDENAKSFYGERPAIDSDIVYYNDLEKTLKTSFLTEITRHKTLSNESLQALLDFLDAMIVNLPFWGNIKDYIMDLHQQLGTKSQWTGSEVYNIVKSLETTHAPIFSSDLDYIKCKGSQPMYRGYSCGLWTLFHTLTVNAALNTSHKGPTVLKAIYGYVKYFFGCTECSEHFQAMAIRNRIFDVKENDKAVLWLWICHNEVNLRLAGDVTEDPEHPKIQFPSATQCPQCRLSRGAWNLPAVYEYLLKVYGAENIQTSRTARSAGSISPFSSLDIGLLSFLYIFCFILLILIIKYFISRHFLRKRRYKHVWGKV